MIGKLVLGILLLSPVPPTYPELLQLTKPEPHVFEVTLSEYEKELIQREKEQEQLRQEYEKGWSPGIATAYYNGKDEMNGVLGITASGFDLDNGSSYQGYHILAADDKFPFKTLIDIELSNGEILHGIVLDRGGSIRGSHFDVVLDTFEDCKQFGRQKMKWKVVR